MSNDTDTTARYEVRDARNRLLGDVATAEHAERIAAYHRDNAYHGVRVQRVEH